MQCKVEGCQSKHHAKNYCSLHYARARSHGDPLKVTRIYHGETGTRLHDIWTSMRQRCMDVNTKSYKHYGLRGIKVCTDWNESYLKFKDWALNNGYSDDLFIDRIDNDGDYEPSNCRFTTRIQNNINRRTIKLNGEAALDIYT